MMTQDKRKTGTETDALAGLLRNAQAEAARATEEAAGWTGSPAELAGLCEDIASRYLDLADRASALALRRTKH